MPSPVRGWIHPPRFYFLAALCVAAVVGCGEAESIRTYKVSREIETENEKVLAAWRKQSQAPRGADDAQAVPGRLLAALLPHGEHTWFFKLLGESAAVGKHVAEVQAFIETVRFEGRTPSWTLPPSWKEKKPPGSDRFATLLIGDAEPPLELAVTALPGDQDVAANVNRWRGQVRLPPLDPAAAQASAVELDTLAGRALWVDVTGKFVPGATMPPFAAMAGGAGAMPADHPPLPNIPKTPVAKLPDAASLPFRYEAPAGWRPGPAVPLSLLTFAVGDEDAPTTITVTPAGGELLDNVNRWRGQLQLPDVDEKTIENAATPLKVDGRSAIYVELIGPNRPEGQRAVYGVIIDDAPPSKWFVKMTGDNSVAFRERERFLAFVTSLKFVGK